MSYLDILKQSFDFISLDISVHSTGWVRYKEGKLDYGTFSIQSEDDLGRRKEFKAFVKGLFGIDYYPIVYIEDVIMGTNFKTTKALIQLNSIVDDLAADGILHIDSINRVDNNHWKKYLRELAGYKPAVKKEDHKIMIINCLGILGFNENVPQDIYDSLGMALAIIHRDKGDLKP